ncbi:MAG: DUF4268 domain-containing protein [Rickettsiales bacterium]
MSIYEITNTKLQRLEETNFSSEGIVERQDLQRLIKEDISVLSDDLFLIKEEFCDWEDSKRRVDLLCIDTDANIVVVELKRSDDGGHMELQAVRYAAMVSKMTFAQLVSIYAKDKQLTEEEAEGDILDFLEWENPNEQEFGNETKIILVSAGFSTELTTSVMWLNEYGLDIRCLRMKPYKTKDGRIMLDVQQIIPLPEAEKYQTQIKSKQQSEKRMNVEKDELILKFWTELLAKSRNITELHSGRTPNKDAWLDTSAGSTGTLRYSTCRESSQARFMVDKADKSGNLSIFNNLKLNKENIEKSFGGELLWEDLPTKKACAISYTINGGYRTPQSEWEEIHKKLIDAMVRLDRAVRPHVKNLNI